jgi:hypothetical protein
MFTFAYVIIFFLGVIVIAVLLEDDGQPPVP